MSSTHAVRWRVRIYDLASRMVELSGMSLRTDANPEGDIAITVTGLRPGEKLGCIWRWRAMCRLEWGECICAHFAPGPVC